MNLLINAARYTEAGGEVELSVEREQDEATVRIRDTGIGIAPDVLPHVFDLFVQRTFGAMNNESLISIPLFV